MWRVYLPLLAAISFGSFAVGAEPRWRDQFLLIEPAKADPRPGIEQLGPPLESLDVPGDPAVKKFLRAESFEKWKVFEDEHLRFSYPDFPGMKVEVVPRGEAQRIPVYGQPLRTTAHSFATVYRVALGEVTWALLFLERAEQLDRGICLCGAVALKTFLAHDGCLYAYSLLESGKLKSMQALGDGWRVQLFEWTHSPLTQAMYLALAESVVLKHPSPRTEQEWRDFTRAKELRRSDAGYGWLRRGMKVEEVLTILGKPARQSERELVYEQINQELLLKQTIRLLLHDGVFRGFSGDCWSYEEIPPERGSLAWAVKLTKRLDKTPASQRGQIFAQDARLALDGFLQQAPAAKDTNWNQWCSVVYKLAEVGVRDARVVPIVEQRFLNPADTMHFAAWILNVYETPSRLKLFQQRLRVTLDGAAQTLEVDHTFSPFSDLHNLLSFLGSAEERAPFVREALAHPHPSIRGSAAIFLNALPEDEARAAARRGLSDSAEYVRLYSARALAKNLATSAETELLVKALRDETKDHVRGPLKEALERSKR